MFIRGSLLHGYGSGPPDPGETALPAPSAPIHTSGECFHHSPFTIHHSAFPSGSQNRLPARLFSLLQIRFFGRKTAFTRSLQGSYCGQHPRFPACILYPRWAVPFSNLWFNSSMNTKSTMDHTENTSPGTAAGPATAPHPASPSPALPIRNPQSVIE